MLVSKQCIMTLQSNLLFSGLKETSVNIALSKISRTCPSGARVDLHFQLYKAGRFKYHDFKYVASRKNKIWDFCVLLSLYSSGGNFCIALLSTQEEDTSSPSRSTAFT